MTRQGPQPPDPLRVLRAVYESIRWDRLYELAPDVDRRQVDELFLHLRQLLAKSPPPPPPGEPAEEVHLLVDGASKGNPGPAGIGVILCTPDGQELEAWGRPIGRATSNVAEYRALLAGLERALARGARKLTILTDSELLARQLDGTYRVRNAALKDLHARVMELLGRFEQWEVRHVRREENARADRLAAQAARKQDRLKNKG